MVFIVYKAVIIPFLVVDIFGRISKVEKCRFNIDTNGQFSTGLL